MCRVLAAMVLLWVCWGSSFPAMRVMVSGLPPLLASGAVFLAAGLVLAALRPGALRGLSRRQIGVSAGVGLCLLGAQGTIAVAMRHVYAGTAALLVAAIPLWVAVLRALCGDRPSGGGVVRLLAGFAGVAVVLGAGSGGDQGWSGWGVVVVVASVAWAAGTLGASRTRVPTRPATVVQLLAGGLMLMVAGFLTGEIAGVTEAQVGAVAWLSFGYLVVVDSLAGFALFNWLLRAAPVSLVSTYSYAVPVVALLVAVLVLGEPFRPVVLMGAVVIVGAVAAEVVAMGRSSPFPPRRSP
ncbi:EamA family transporter [Nonomuraea sp. NPDC050404]|uniref:DMT family transporter n=1 Tax=Nonomuraea sp. NPDC050404 TaxID=3155783 RepID=UPI00340F90F2